MHRGCVLSEGYGHDGPGVCLGDGQTVSYLKDMDMTVLASAWAMAGHWLDCCSIIVARLL